MMVKLKYDRFFFQSLPIFRGHLLLVLGSVSHFSSFDSSLKFLQMITFFGRGEQKLCHLSSDQLGPLVMNAVYVGD